MPQQPDSSVHVRPEREFVSCRASLQRLHDAAFLGGWIEQLTHNQAHVRLVGTRPVLLGESFYVEAHGPLSMMSFKATCVAIHDEPLAGYPAGDSAANALGALVELRFMDRAAFHPPKERCRKIATALTGVLQSGGASYDVNVVDVGLEGAGLWLTRGIQKGMEVELTVTSSKRAVTVTGLIRHVRNPSEGVYFAGLEIVQMDRVQKILWQELFQTI